MTKVMLTGAAGFMGSHIAEYLAKSHYEVHGVDDLSGGFEANVPKNCIFHKLDLRDQYATNGLIQHIKPDVIFALAANAREGASFFQPLSATERNVNVYMNILEPAIKHGLKKVIYFSSMAVYGEQPSPFDETQERKPCDVYGESKSWCEHVTEMLAAAHGFKYVIIRPHNVFGERQSMVDVYRNVVAIFMNRIMRGEPLYIYGDGEQKRAFSYIESSLPCYVKCMDDQIDGQIFNIGGTREITINELVAMVMANFPEYPKPEIIHLKDRHGEVKNAWSTYRKSVDLLGYEEKTTLEDAIAKMSVWAKLMGPQEWTNERLPLINDKVPTTWTMDRNKSRKELTHA